MGDGFAFLFPIMFITLAGMFLLVWRWGAPIAKWWGLGFLCSGLAASVPALPNVIPMMVRGTIANALFGLAFFHFGGALLRRADAPLMTGVRIAILVVSVGGAVFGLAIRNLHLQIFASDLGCALLMGIGLPATTKRLRDLMDCALFAIVALVTFETFLQAVTVTITLPEQDGTGVYMTSTYAFLMQSSAVVLGLIQALVALASVVLDRIEADRQTDLRDPLTGLTTRPGLDHALKVKPRGSDATFILCEVDNLREASDLFGPQAPDRIIIRIADMIRAECPVGGVAARIGDQRFLLYVPTGGPAAAAPIAERLTNAIYRYDWSGSGVVPAALGGLSLAALLSIKCQVLREPF
ncbi:GGDEF domain-containing protein [Sphingomonas montanisoli]|uniref:GGDEF domain-containing protein n=1 Tax=Sphingomonas montanisoli TaxID=2606412 RepID=A0A5D9C7I9_9SPHN|nr:GGDEF domain-containing protein [Sphingomonas montanisoli]TZG27724.1 GGDEF domain-containing protein [Sphingomonas montanisoli]